VNSIIQQVRNNLLYFLNRRTFHCFRTTVTESDISNIYS